MILVSCSSENPPEDVIDEELYETMFTEFVILNQINTHLITDQERDSLRNEVYVHYDVPKEKFRLSHEYYQNKPEIQSVRIDSISSNLRSLRDKIDEARREEERQAQEQADSLNQ